MITHTTCKRALEVYGINHQIWKTIEELSELSNALAKWKDGRNDENDVITEIADVQIMMEQLSIFFGEQKVQDERLEKITRLKGRIDKEIGS